MKKGFGAFVCVKCPLPTRGGMAVAALAYALASSNAHSFKIDTENSDLAIRWDNTLKYSAAWRLKDPSTTLTSSPNFDDGDRNFKKGLISNRVDLLTEMDVAYQNFGARVSGAAWYDNVYNHSNDNNSPGTINQFSRPYNQFTEATEELHGRKAELLDAFVFGKSALGNGSLSFRLGRHALLWGESLFMGINGIAAGMAPIDVIKAQSVPNTQFKELIRPTEQVSGQWQINPDFSIGAYYQFRWEKNRLPAVGSYFSAVDFFGPGAERLLFFGPFAATVGDDMKAKNSGQGGLQARFRVGETDYGLYAIRYHDKSPQTYTRNLLAGTPPDVHLPGQLLYVYPEDIKSFGASFSRTIGVVNLAGELSFRRNMPLASDAQMDLFGTVPPAFGGPGSPANNNDNPLYAVGKTVHAQISWLANLEPNFLAKEASFLGEIAWNRTTSITRNPGALNPYADRDAWNLRMIFEPTYRQVLPGLDVSVPVGLGYGKGNSSALGAAFLGDGVGDISIGISGTYLQVWNINLNYTHFYGPEGLFIDSANHVTYKQSFKDRNFVSLSLRRTF